MYDPMTDVWIAIGIAQLPVVLTHSLYFVKQEPDKRYQTK